MSLHFQKFQRDMAAHLRQPHHTPRPAGVPARPLALYAELVFNNLSGLLEPCFPVCRQMLGDARWQRLCRTFLRDWPLHTPWFREIPRAFSRYLASAAIAQPLPAWLAELAHYEWAELAVDVMDVVVPEYQPAGDLLNDPIQLNPALMNLSYSWPVHCISPQYRPRRRRPCHLLVYRSSEGSVRFSEISPSTARLIDLLSATPRSGSQALEILAAELAHPNPQGLRSHGATLLEELRELGIILGSTS